MALNKILLKHASEGRFLESHPETSGCPVQIGNVKATKGKHQFLWELGYNFNNPLN
jgi:hypothetical protein